MTLGIIITGGVIAAVSAYILFKIKESDNPVVNSLQPLFFFMIMASFIIMGSASFQSTQDCAYLVNQTTSGAGPGNNQTHYQYTYQCTAIAESAGSWSYRLPLWFGYIGGSYVIVYMLYLIWQFYNNTIGGRKRGEE